MTVDAALEAPLAPDSCRLWLLLAPRCDERFDDDDELRRAVPFRLERAEAPDDLRSPELRDPEELALPPDLVFPDDLLAAAELFVPSLPLALVEDFFAELARTLSGVVDLFSAISTSFPRREYPARDFVHTLLTAPVRTWEDET